jgi:hypothetical protein
MPADARYMQEPPKSTPGCPHGSIAVYLPNARLFAPAWCRRWKCPRCAKAKARALAKRIARCNANRFVTLTCAPNPELTAQEQLDVLNAAWRTLWKRWKRQNPNAKHGYVRVVERHKNGAPHLHIAVRAPYLPQKVLSAWWLELTGNFIVDIRAITSPRATGRYLAAYLTKDITGITARRKWSATPRWLPASPVPEPEPGELPLGWKWRSKATDELIDAAVAMGFLPASTGWYLRPEVSAPTHPIPL